MTITKEIIIKKIGLNTGYNRFESKKVLDQLLDLIFTKLGKGEDVLISGFGKFRISDKGSRIGRNPHTMEEIKLQARRVVTFRPAENLRQKTNFSEEYLRQAAIRDAVLLSDNYEPTN
ncbi:MAG: HU family DNA-binding protein [Deltaproteobacteria bacterium]|jgi:integration host factor subunit alpha|nr:HU family DNA-binding protein [Deltaproteobacteria bacterium]